MNDTLEPIIAFIKEKRQQGLDDIEVEQQMLLGTWSKSELDIGRNFLHLTQKHSLVESPEAKEVLSKEKNFRKRRAGFRFMIYWVLPIGATVLFSVLVGLLLNNFSYSLIGNKDKPVAVVSTPPQTEDASARQESTSTVVCADDRKICTGRNFLSKFLPVCIFAQCSQ